MHRNGGRIYLQFDRHRSTYRIYQQFDQPTEEVYAIETRSQAQRREREEVTRLAKEISIGVRPRLITERQ